MVNVWESLSLRIGYAKRMLVAVTGIDYALYVEYIRQCIDENFDVPEAMEGVVSPLLVSP